MRIPEVQEEMLWWADASMTDAITAEKLRYWVKELYRRKPVRRAPAKKQLPRAERQPLVIAYAAAHPEASEHEIANALGVTNSGRISEDLAGYRT